MFKDKIKQRSKLPGYKVADWVIHGLLLACQLYLTNRDSEEMKKRRFKVNKICSVRRY